MGGEPGEYSRAAGDVEDAPSSDDSEGVEGSLGESSAEDGIEMLCVRESRRLVIEGVRAPFDPRGTDVSPCCRGLYSVFERSSRLR